MLLSPKAPRAKALFRFTTVLLVVLGCLTALSAYGPARAVRRVAAVVQRAQPSSRAAAFNQTVSPSQQPGIRPASLQANGKIEFDSNRDGNNEIYVMNADGTGQTNLTNNPADDSGTSFSPDGSKIVFSSTRDSNQEVYVMNTDGSSQTRLTNNPASDGIASFSSVGGKIVFVSNRDGNKEIYVMNADGSGQTNVTNNPADDQSPSFSPDDSKIVFESFRDGSGEIYVMNTNGSGQTRLTNNPNGNGGASFSPDGNKITFTSHRDGNFEIYVMNADGTGQTNLSNNPGSQELSSAFSPDGSKIVFASDRDGNFEIYVMNTDGSGQTRLTNNPATDATPHWQTLLNCTPPPPNMVAWYRAEENAADSIGMNNGTLQGGATIASGFVGQAFSFDGVDDHVQVNASASLDVGAGGGLTIDAWIKPSDLSVERPLVEWNNGSGSAGAHLWFDLPAAGNRLFANIVDTSGGSHFIGAAAGSGSITADSFQHVALTYDKASGLARLYRNGTQIAEQILGTFTPQTSYNLFFGLRPSGSLAGRRYVGLMDEVSIYARALAEPEIKNIYDAKNEGKCQASPSQAITVSNTNDSGPGSLRQAILDANASPGMQTIAFQIPGSGVHTISPTSALPDITDPVVIDGYTQPGASENTSPTGTNAVLLIELNGTNAGPTANGINVTGGGSTIRGLVINRFSFDGISLQAGGNTIQGNFIGTNAAGTAALGNSGFGVQIQSANNLIGGTTPAARNLISGNGANAASGIQIVSAAATGNVVQGNYIGTNAAGTASVRNILDGVEISQNASGNTIGGAAAGAGNLISTNGRHGVRLVSNPANNRVEGNVITGNAASGIDASFGGTGNRFDANSINSNGQLGIDLSPTGVTPNDAGDADTGPNNLQNFPVLSAAIAGIITNVQGTLNSTANTQFTVQFFANASCDPSGNGEGQTFLGSTSVTTDASGNASFNAMLASATSAGQSVTATATDANGNTSEFSQCVTVTVAANATLGNYANTTVQLGANTTITPDAAPTNTTRIDVSTSTNFKGRLEGDPTTGVVRLTDAHPAGTYTVTVRAFDTAGMSTTKTFTLTVTTPATCNPVTFAAAANFGVGTTPFSVAVGDFNGDGKQDLVTANISNDVSVLLGDGAGGFGAATNFPVSNFGRPVSVAVGDFNGDGKQDLVTANFNANNVSVLLGNGTGNFGTALNFAVGTNPNSVTVGDFNGDGKPDIATANQGSNNVSVLLGDGAGSFSAATNLGAGTNPFSLTVGDFNGDSKQDLVAANLLSNNVSVLLGNGAGSFGTATNFPVASAPRSVAVGDFNGDGKQDLATPNQGSNNVSVLLGDGAGSFSPAANFAVGVNPISLAIGDFNGDGKQDLATAKGANDVSILLGDGAGGFGAVVNFAVGNSPQAVAVGDFNGDGKQDLATASQNSNNVSVLLRQCPTSTTLSVTNTNDSGAGSLRQAILDSNATAGTQTITFNIPGAGLHTISPTSVLPNITDPVVIDGYTQPGASVNTLTNGDNAVLLVELNGTNAGFQEIGFNVTGGSSTIRGLVINRFGSDAIQLQTAGNIIEGNFIGTNAAGTAALGNSGVGIYLRGANSNTIGGTTPAARNLISGNSSGIRCATSNNVIQGNYVGTNAAGTAAISNANTGIDLARDGLTDPNNNTVGGTTPGAGNLVSGNGVNGVRVISAFNASGNVIQGNRIGTDVTGTLPVGNGRHGVTVSNPGNTVGGTAAGAANIIAFNGRAGVSIGDSSTGVNNGMINIPVRRNVIFANTGLGIDLGDDGLTANDAGDGDAGPNNLQNFTVLTSAQASGGNTTIQGTLNSTANTVFQVDFYSNAACDPSGNGEGQTFLGSTQVTTDAQGNAAINATLASATAAGQTVTATATDPNGNTSEFSTCFAVTGPVQTFTISGHVVDGNGGNLSGVTMTLGGSAAATTTTDNLGNYAFSGLAAGGNYTVTPSRNGFTFNPPSSSFTGLAANMTANFTGTLNVFTISGQITTNEAALPGVTVNLSGSQSATTTTDAAGNYTFANLAGGGSYIVTPQRSGFTFNPASRTFNNLAANQTADFAGTLSPGGAQSISGRVTDRSMPIGNAIAGVTLTLRDALTEAVLATTMTNAAGSYSFDAPAGGDYRVTPSKINTIFTPAAHTFLNLRAPQTGDFNGVTSISINGRLLDENNRGVEGVTMILSGTVTRRTQTTAGGEYLFTNLPPGGTYTIKPEDNVRIYTPSRVDVPPTESTTNRSKNFSGVPNPNPTPTPPIVGDFSGTVRDPQVFSLGLLTQPPGSTDPLVTVVQQNGRLVIAPRSGVTDASFNGYVTVDAVDFTNATAAVEVVQTADNGAQTIFGVGADERNYFRFVAQDLEPATPAARGSKGLGVTPQAETLRQLIFQVRQAGVLLPLQGPNSVPLDPVLMRFWRFRHDAATRTMFFETSPTGLDGSWTQRAAFLLPGGIGALATELSAGTAGAISNPGQAIFDNLLVSPSATAFRLGTFRLVNTSFRLSEGVGSFNLTVERTGDTTVPAAVTFATDPFDGQPCARVDGKARARCDFQTSVGRLRFAPGETQQTVTFFVTDDSYTEGDETFRVALGNPSESFGIADPRFATITVADNEQGPVARPAQSVSPSVIVQAVNPVSTAPFFVRQQYLDFLSREPEPTGFNAWVNVLMGCAFEGFPGPGKTGSDPTCDRLTVSGAFFGSPEFQQKGYFVIRFYRATLPDLFATGAGGRLPSYEEFLTDVNSLAGGQTVAEVEARRVAFTEAWLERPDVRALYEGLSDADYVDKLAATAGFTLANRTQLIADLAAGRQTRAQVLRTVVDNPDYYNREFYSAFVLMQYFGYLQRDPDPAGYRSWLDYLNATGDFRTMLNGFVYSFEYQSRFGTP